jgi:hypothetical protein
MSSDSSSPYRDGHEGSGFNCTVALRPSGRTAVGRSVMADANTSDLRAVEFTLSRNSVRRPPSAPR